MINQNISQGPHVETHCSGPGWEEAGSHMEWDKSNPASWKRKLQVWKGRSKEQTILNSWMWVASLC